MISMVWATPMILGSIQPTPHSAISPLLEKAVENTASSEATRMSQYKDMIKPTPAAGPLIAAIIGFGTEGK